MSRRPVIPGFHPDPSFCRVGDMYYLVCSTFEYAPGVPLFRSTDRVLTERRPLWQGTGGKFPEGPHLYKIGDLWYLLIAEGGTERGHAVTIARGPSPSGPFEPCPSNPLITARGTGDPVQNTGHADLVQRPGLVRSP